MELTERFSYINTDFDADDSIPAALPDEENDESNVTPDAEEYDPHHHSTSEEPTTYLNTVLTYLKASIGTGVFAMPSAFKESGYVVGVIGVFLISLFYTICVHLLVSSEYELCRRRRLPNLTYGATVNAAFTDGPSRLRRLAGISEKITNFLMLAYQCGGCAVYIIFISSNVKRLIGFHLSTDLDLQMVMACTTFLVILLCWVRNLKIIAPLTAVAHIATITSFVLVLWYMSWEPTHEGERRAVQSATRLPRYLSMVVFTTTCSGVVLPLKTGMRNPQLFSTPMGVMNMSMVPVTLLCVLFGLLGYMKYGDTVKASITLDLPITELPAQCVLWLFSVSIYISFFWCFFIVFEIVWKDYLETKIQNFKIVCEYGVRTLIPTFTFLLAYAIPDLEVFMALVGAFGIVSTSLVIPIIVHTLVFWNTSSNFMYFASRNMILLALSMVILVVCIVDSVSSILVLWSS